MFLFIVDDCIENKTDYYGADVENLFDVESPEDCQLECQADHRCEYWTFGYIVALTCILKSAKLQVSQNDIYTSGPKYCPGNMVTKRVFFLK